jgi:hypothetical protein
MWWLFLLPFSGFALASFSMGEDYEMLFENIGCRNQCFTQRIIKTIYFFCAIGFVIGVVPAYLLLENGSKILHTELQFKFFLCNCFSVFTVLNINNCFGKSFSSNQDV